MGRVVGALARRLPRIHAITGTARRLPLSKRGNFGDILATWQECVAGGFLPRARLQDGRQLRQPEARKARRGLCRTVLSRALDRRRRGTPSAGHCKSRSPAALH